MISGAKMDRPKRMNLRQRILMVEVPGSGTLITRTDQQQRNVVRIQFHSCRSKLPRTAFQVRERVESGLTISMVPRPFGAETHPTLVVAVPFVEVSMSVILWFSKAIKAAFTFSFSDTPSPACVW